jgi:MoaA/NifB/PqqE/SkfB family radical SAM enzyme
MTLDLLLDGFLSNIKDRPFNLDFAVTYRCNLKCIQCNVWRYYIDFPEKLKEELSVEEINKVFFSYRHFRIIGVTGGEPFLRDDLIEILNIIIQSQNKLKYLFITTNGAFPHKTKRTIEIILNNMHNFKNSFKLVLLVSIDGPERMHDFIRGTHGAYKKAITTIKILHNLHLKYNNFSLGTVTVCSPFNIHQFDTIIENIKNLKLEYDLEPSFCVWFSGQLYKNLDQQKEIDVVVFRKKLIN